MFKVGDRVTVIKEVEWNKAIRPGMKGTVVEVDPTPSMHYITSKSPHYAVKLEGIKRQREVKDGIYYFDDDQIFQNGLDRAKGVLKCRR